MAMTMTGRVVLPAGRAAVWEKLNDAEVLGACIPGCRSFDRTGGSSFAAVADVQVGPIKATFHGRVDLSNIDPPNGYELKGEGAGGVAGFAKGGAKIHLEDAPEGTVLTYDVEALIGGKLAQLGGRLINGVAKKYADQFFNKFAESFEPSPG